MEVTLDLEAVESAVKEALICLGACPNVPAAQGNWGQAVARLIELMDSCGAVNMNYDGTADWCFRVLPDGTVDGAAAPRPISCGLV
jgi:hypothetical protein